MAAIATFRRLAKTVWRQPDWILALAISLAAVWLHFFFLCHAGGFWRDEVNLLNLSGRHSLAEMSKDSFPVLMPLLVSGWTAIGLGHHDLSLRLLGTLIGLALPSALWLTVWKIRRAPPVLGLVLIALNSTVIMFGDSMRAYGLGSLTILLTVAAACPFLKNPTWRNAGWLAALAILSVQALYQNAVFIAAICFGAWAVCVRQQNWRAAMKILVVAITSAASLLPYWSHIVSMPNAAAALRTGFEPELALINLDKATGFPLEQYLWVWGFLAVAVVVCAGAALRRVGPGSQMENPPSTDWSLVAAALLTASGFMWFAAKPPNRWFLLPLMMLAIAGLDSSRLMKRFFPRWMTGARPHSEAAPADGIAARDLPLFAGVTLLTAVAAFAGFLRFAAMATEPWYFIPLMALAAGCFEIGLPLSGRHARAAVFGFAVMTVIGVFLFAREELNWRFTNIDLVAQRVAAEAGPDDFIVVTPWYCGISFDRYFKGPTPWNTLPPLADHSKHRYDLVREKMETRGALQPVVAQMASTLQAGHRVWVVGVLDIPKPDDPPVTEPGPPPLKYSGWSDRPYNSTWATEAALFLAQHSRKFSVVYYTTNQNIAPENLKLGRAEGWRDNLTSTNSQPIAK